MPKLNWFRKELVNMPVLVDGQRVQWEVIGGNRGLLVLDEEKPEHVGLIAGLKKFAEMRKYGVVVIDEAEYELKKKSQLPWLNSARRKPEKLRVFQPLKPKSPSPEKAAPVVSAPAAPASIEAVNAIVKADMELGISLAKEGKPLPEGANEVVKRGYAIIDPKTKLRLDGPTVEEYLKAGYKPENYPPEGYLPRKAEVFKPRTGKKDEAPKPPAATEEIKKAA